MIRRIRLKIRIIIALAAIAAIHLSFYVVPRWWYSRPRFYAEAYEAAVAAARREFGDAAVDRGVIYIPKSRISVPREGQAAIRGYGYKVLYLSLSPEESYIFCSEWKNRTQRLATASLEYEGARNLWALFAYAENASVGGASGECDDSRQYFGATRLCDRTWPRMAAKRTDMKRSYSHSRTASPGDVARRLLRSRVLADVTSPTQMGATEDPVVIEQALRAVIEASMPICDKADTYRLLEFTAEYARIAGKRALPVLERMDDLASRELSAPTRFRPAWVYKVPLFGPWLRRKDYSATGYDDLDMSYPIAAAEIWKVENVYGKPAPDQARVLADAALPDGHAGDLRIFSDEARKLFAELFPGEYRDFLVENFDRLCDRKRATSLPYWWLEAVKADERFARLAATDGPSLENARVCKALYRLTGDAAYIRGLETAIEDNMGGPDDDRLHMATDALTEICAAPPLDSAAVAFMRDMMGRPTPVLVVSEARILDHDRSSLFSTALHFSAKSGSDEWRRLAEDVLLRPSHVLSEDYLATDSAAVLRATAAEALGRCDGARGAPALLEYLASQAALGDGRVASAVIDALGESGAKEALAPLVELLPGRNSPTDSLSDDRRERVRRAIATIELKNASRPVARFLTMSEEDRLLVTADTLGEVFSEDDLHVLLADESCRGCRTAILTALATLRARAEEPVEDY